jgi:GNAT superfamily N-acetyltransferase
MTVLLRPTTEADLPSVGALHHRSRVSAYRDFVPEDSLETGGPLAMGQYWQERWKHERDVCRLTIADNEGFVVGFSYLGPSEEPGVGILNAIHVAPEYVGDGVGRLLMIDALSFLRPFGDQAVLWVLTGNKRARAFYERGGWEHDGMTRIESIGGEPVPQMRYRRQL